MNQLHRSKKKIYIKDLGVKGTIAPPAPIPVPTALSINSSRVRREKIVNKVSCLMRCHRNRIWIEELFCPLELGRCLAIEFAHMYNFKMMSDARKYKR